MSGIPVTGTNTETILVPLAGRDVNELRLLLAIFGIEAISHDDHFITVNNVLSDFMQEVLRSLGNTE